VIAGTAAEIHRREITVTKDIADAVEAELIALSELLTEPGERECLRCFLLRMSSEFGCDGTHRWTIRWRDARAPQATGLLRKLAELRGCCDCEVLMNVFPEYPSSGRLLPCAGQPQRGSAVPCDLRMLRRTA
jgi:Protein of unknown function (DUF2695)